MKNINNSRGGAGLVSKGAVKGLSLSTGAALLKSPLTHLIDKLKRYEELFGDIKELKQVTEYTGEVLDVEIPDLPDGVRIAFQRPSGELIRVFPKKRVEAIGAAFPTAQVEYVMYEMGSTNISVLRSVGPLPEDSLAEDFDELSKDTLEDLEKNEWRG